MNKKQRAMLISQADYEKDIKLLPHQEEAINYFDSLLAINPENKRFYFGLKMGLGKTYNSLIWFQRQGVKDFFIVTKQKLLKQWARNYVHIFKNENFEILDEPKSEELVFQAKEPKVWICSYERFKKILAIENAKEWTLARRERYNVILDESQVLKSHRSQISKNFLKLSQLNKINYLSLLSGSAISNDLYSLFTQFALLNQLKTGFWKWADKYFRIQPGQYSDYEITGIDKQKAAQLISDFSRRGHFVKTEDVLTVNGIEHINLQSYANNKDKENMANLRDKDLVREGVIVDVENNFVSPATTALVRANRMKQLVSGFVYGYFVPADLIKDYQDFDNLFKDGYIGREEQNAILSKQTTWQDLTDNAKRRRAWRAKTKDVPQYKLTVPEMLDSDKFRRVIKWMPNPFKEALFNDKLADEQNYIVFYNFSAEKSIITRLAKEADYTVYYIDGSTNDLDKILSEDKKEKCLVVAQIQAAAQGIDGLQKNYANVIHYSLPYSSELYEQANARAHRTGQEKNVNIFHLITHPLESMVLDKLKLGQDYKDAIFANDVSKLFKELDGDNAVLDFM